MSTEGGPQVCYDDDAAGCAYFARVCPTCGRYVKADAEATFDGRGQPVGPNATCRAHGRVQMPFEGYP